MIAFPMNARFSPRRPVARRLLSAERAAIVLLLGLFAAFALASASQPPAAQPVSPAGSDGSRPLVNLLVSGSTLGYTTPCG